MPIGLSRKQPNPALRMALEAPVAAKRRKQRATGLWPAPRKPRHLILSRMFGTAHTVPIYRYILFY